MFKHFALELFKALVAWLSAVFLIALIGLTLHKFLRDTQTISLIALGGGVFMVMLSYFSLKRASSTYEEHFFIALSFAGQALIIFSISELFHIDKIEYLILLLEILLLLLFNNHIHKFLNAFFAFSALFFLFYDFHMDYLGVFVGLNFILLSTLHLKTKESLIISYGALGAILWVVLTQSKIFMPTSYKEIETLLLALPFGYLLFYLSRFYNIKKLSALLAILLLFIVSIGLSFFIKYFLVALTLFILGCFLGDIFILASSIIIGIFIITYFYYTLNTTLAFKSLLLISSGILGLIIRYLLHLQNKENR